MLSLIFGIFCGVLIGAAAMFGIAVCVFQDALDYWKKM